MYIEKFGTKGPVGIFLHSCKKYDVIVRYNTYILWFKKLICLYLSTFSLNFRSSNVHQSCRKGLQMYYTTFLFFDNIFFYFFKKPFLFFAVVPPSTEDLRDSRCGSNLSLLQEGANSLHYSNPTLLASPPTQWVKIS